MEVTAKAADGKEIFREERNYHPQASTCRDSKMMYGAQWKVQNIRDTSLQPYSTKAETFEIKLPEGVRTADVTVDLFYEVHNPDYKIPIHKISKTVTLDR